MASADRQSWARVPPHLAWKHPGLPPIWCASSPVLPYGVAAHALPHGSAAPAMGDFVRGVVLSQVGSEIGRCVAPAAWRAPAPDVPSCGTCRFFETHPSALFVYGRHPGPEHSARCGSRRRGPGVYTGAGRGALEGGVGRGTCVRTCDRRPDNCGLQKTTPCRPSAASTTPAWSGLVGCFALSGTQNPPGATPCEFDSRLGHSTSSSTSRPT
jgi:hypothetical protein